MSSAEYDSRVDELVIRWRDDVYNGVLVDDVLLAIRIYACASLQGMTDEYDVPATFPMLGDEAELSDHYGNALFARLSGSCTSIRNALQAVQAHMDCHAAIAVSRRAYESLWQVFWLCNPAKDGNARIRRLLILTKQEINDVLKVFPDGTNAEVESALRGYLSNIQKIVGKSRYQSKDGRQEYRDHFAPLFNDPLPPGLPPAPPHIRTDDVTWSMMNNMTHPNVVFDWLNQIQRDAQDRMDTFQLMPVFGAIGVVNNLCTLIMEQARLPDDPIQRVNASIQESAWAACSLLEMNRN